MQDATPFPMDPDDKVLHDFLPFIRQYKSGRVVRCLNTETVPAGTDTASTSVSSKDVVINTSSGIWVRIYLPAFPAGGRRDKLPVVVYYHGGAFVVGSTAQQPTHLYLNSLAADANVLIVSTEYRLAPEHPLPTAYEDSWEGLKWVASHATGEGSEPWLAEHGDLSRVFLVGVSAGGNIAHNVAVRAGAHRLGVDIKGMLVVHPLFNREAGIGGEASVDRARKAKSDAFWRFRCPGTPGLDDPLCNPFSEAAGGSAARIACGRVLVCVAEKDVLRDAGVWYYDSLRASGYRGEVELLESVGEGHVFHYTNPGCEQARVLHARVVSFLRDE
ncbi:tuliposide A-converting enzyme 1, chloroplastic-like [Phragmites australis]|uniref:tuliposide A-converting enzyme 1, chloroplastic-like n=1 Tax=Phragmites australis TaxID=29695 RepID=UPI002D7A125F|nr:tuliposide A-converting enzyme 1, chloroplastic-like [Phragmites australis]